LSCSKTLSWPRPRDRGQTTRLGALGGGIPLCSALADLCPRAEILLIGLSEPEAHIYAVDEGVSVDELQRLSATEVHCLRNYAVETDRSGK